MSRYKKIMLQRGVMQKDVLADVRKVDPRVDNPLLSKFVNDVCLPSPRTLESICKSLSCAPLDIYDPREIELAPRSDSDVENAATTGGGHSTTAGAVKKRARRRDKNLYNLTVEIPRDVAERVFAPAALRKLGYLSKSDFVRQAVAALDAKLSTIENKEKPPTRERRTANNNRCEIATIFRQRIGRRNWHFRPPARFDKISSTKPILLYHIGGIMSTLCTACTVLLASS